MDKYSQSLLRIHGKYIKTYFAFQSANDSVRYFESQYIYYLFFFDYNTIRSVVQYSIGWKVFVYRTDT